MPLAQETQMCVRQARSKKEASLQDASFFVLLFTDASF